jgi:hypothetical protein
MLQRIQFALGKKQYQGLAFFKHDGTAIHRHKLRYTPSKDRYIKKDVVLLVRNPIDAVVSGYHMLASRLAHKNLKLPDYIRSYRGIPFMVQFMNDWANQQGTPKRFLCIHYEDFKSEPFWNLKNLCLWIGVGEMELSDACYREAVDICSFENMRDHDRECLLPAMKKQVPKIKLDDPQVYSVRGIPPDLSEEDRNWAVRYINDNLDPFYSRYFHGVPSTLAT